jgi:hypothetical protein
MPFATVNEYRLAYGLQLAMDPRIAVIGGIMAIVALVIIITHHVGKWTGSFCQ